MTNSLDVTDIKAWHAHLYFGDDKELEIAKEVAQLLDQKFTVRVGRFHRQPVGPHTRWSCQVSFVGEEFAKLVPWLLLNRRGLDVFLHPVTGQDYWDHTEGTAWLGRSWPLDLSIFQV